MSAGHRRRRTLEDVFDSVMYVALILFALVLLAGWWGWVPE